MNLSTKALVALITLPLIAACGRAPSSLLRQGQLPVYDFPLYLSESAPGNLWKIDRHASKTLVASGLNNPFGIATDRYNNVYVIETGANRLVRIDAESGNLTTIAENLGSPVAVAVDGFGEPFVIQADDNSIVRASDGALFARFNSTPSGLVFGVGGVMIVSFDGAGRVDWIRNPKQIAEGTTAEEYMTSADRVSATSLQQPTGLSIDGMGRVYVVESTSGNARILRYNQDGPTDRTIISNKVVLPNAAVSDPVGNVFLINGGEAQIDVAPFDGADSYFGWLKGLDSPQGLAFTQY